MKMKDALQGAGLPVAYFPRLAEFLGSVKAAIFMCQLIYWEGKQRDPNGWIYKTREEMTEETGMSRSEQETARASLREKGYLSEKKAGIPCKVHYKINWKKFEEEWTDWSLKKKGFSLQKSRQQGGGNSASRVAGKQQTTTENTPETFKDYNAALLKSMKMPSAGDHDL